MNLIGRKFKNSRLDVEIYVYEVEDTEWFIGKDIIKLLGYSENSKPLRKWGEKGAIVWEKNKKKIYVQTLEIIESNGYVTTMTINNNIIFVSKEGVLQLVAGAEILTQQQKKEWYSLFGINNVFTSRKEIEFGSMLIEALEELDLEVKTQYNVDSYRIDFYIPKLNIAVEYDEEHHFTEANIKKDIERQTYIEEKIGAKFIRCDYRDNDIKNVMKVLKEIMQNKNN